MVTQKEVATMIKQRLYVRTFINYQRSIFFEVNMDNPEFLYGYEYIIPYFAY